MSKYLCLMPQLETKAKVVYFYMNSEGYFNGLSYIRTKGEV